MEEKKRKDTIIPILVAIVALVGLSLWYHYLGEFTIQKVDAALGIDHEFEITDLVIEKGYNTDSGLKQPEIIINYKTTKEVASYIQVNDKTSDMNIGKEFTKKIILSRDYFGQSVNIVIFAKDETGKTKTVERTVNLPQNIEPTIAVINT